MTSPILNTLGFSPVRWEDNRLIVLDQRRLPNHEEYLVLKTPLETAESIANLAVRGAPLIGIVAAYGLCLVENPHDEKTFMDAGRLLAATRPTAVNLAWALERMKKHRQSHIECMNLRQILVDEAQNIHADDARMCSMIGEVGNSIIESGISILTHCNAGALATGGIGTALGIIYTAHYAGKGIEVWVDETRPVLQGARLTAWELSRAGVPYTLISDNMAGTLMAQGKVGLVITGADRVASNYDVANKIGTYGLAVLAQYHRIPFYVAAPTSTFDSGCPNGQSITIEERNSSEITKMGNNAIAPDTARVYNPAFDITPAKLLTGIITENGIIYPPKVG